MSIFCWYTFKVANWNQLKPELLRWNELIDFQSSSLVEITALGH